MTETMGNPTGGSATGGSATGGSAGGTTKDVAKDEAKGVAQDAMHGGKATAETAKEQAGQVASEAASQARQLADQAREQLNSQGAAQKEKATSGLRSLADELQGMVEGQGTSQGAVAGLARDASERVRTAAQWLETHEPGDVLAEARRFARQRPGMFLLSAAAVGFLGGRITRSLGDEVKEYAEAEERRSGTSIGTGPRTSAPLAGGTTAGPVGGTGYVEPGYATTTGTGLHASGGDLPETAPGTPGYAVPPVADSDRGDATTEFAPNVGKGGDQMPSEFGARGTGAQGNRPEEDKR